MTHGGDRMMERVPEPELMEEEEQARAYSMADFEAPHEAFVRESERAFHEPLQGQILDLGCGPGDITVRFAKRHPGCSLLGIDGSEAMLKYGRERVEREELTERVRLRRVFLPTKELEQAFDGAISNSLLHHLERPEVLWQSLKQCVRRGSPVFVMDLLRPGSRQEAEALVEAYSGDEPEVLRRDFFLSLCAAYRVDEIEEQLATQGLAHLRVEVISDRHWVVYGRL